MSLIKPGAAQTAQTTTWRIGFTNIATTACTLEGAPGVSLVTRGNGSLLGRPAVTREPAAPPVVRLAHGDTAHATLVLQTVQPGGPTPHGCTPTRADGFRVYPPKSYQAAIVRESGTYGCLTGPAILTISNVTR